MELVEFIKRFKIVRKLTESVNVSQRYRARSEVVVGRMVGQISYLEVIFAWQSPSLGAYLIPNILGLNKAYIDNF